MTKANVKAGMVVVTRDGATRLVMPTTAGLVLVKDDMRHFTVLDKYNDDLTYQGTANAGKDIVAVYGLPTSDTTNFVSTDFRDLLFSEDGDVDDIGDDFDDDDMDDDDDSDTDVSDDDIPVTSAPAPAPTSGSPKADLAIGDLVKLRGEDDYRAVLATKDGLVLCKKDLRYFKNVAKYNDDLTHVNKAANDIMVVYGAAPLTTTDFFSPDGRAVKFSR